MSATPNLSAYDALKPIAEELAQRKLWKLNWLIRQEMSILLQRNGENGVAERGEFPIGRAEEGGLK